jgi:hypothetical protein
MPLLQELASGAYMNEADCRNPTWKEEFHGTNWDRLDEIKKKYDPNGIFNAPTAVGSEKWQADEQGRLCRVWSEGHGGTLFTLPDSIQQSLLSHYVADM